MQSFIDQARKKGIVLFDKGKCQFCNADYPHGIFDCMHNYNNGFEHLDFNKPDYHITRFLSVDAHALQHPEIHGRWSNHFHLTRLNLILDEKLQWDYKKSTLLSEYLKNYKLIKPNEFLDLPEPLNRGGITIRDISRTGTTGESIELINRWAEEVYNAWSPNHSLVSQIAKGYIKKNNY